MDFIVTRHSEKDLTSLPSYCSVNHSNPAEILSHLSSAIWRNHSHVNIKLLCVVSFPPYLKRIAKFLLQVKSIWQQEKLNIRLGKGFKKKKSSNHALIWSPQKYFLVVKLSSDCWHLSIHKIILQKLFKLIFHPQAFSIFWAYLHI